MALQFTKMRGFATTHGQDFEVNLAALLFLRGLNSDLDFQLGTNVAGAGAMDDVVFRFKHRGELDTCWTTLYVQLKHKETARVTKQMLEGPKGEFALPKYFQSYREVKESMSAPARETLFDGSFEQCVFAIFTNAKASDSLGEGRCEDLSRAEEFLWTESGSVFSFAEDEDMLRCLGDCGDDGAKFLSRLRVFCDQPKVVRLRAAVRDELYNVADEIVHGVDARRVCAAFLDNAKDWWEKSRDILHRDHDLLLRAVRQVRLESSCQKTLTEFRLDVEFEDEAISLLRQTLAGDVAKVVVIESSASSFRLSLTKVLQAVGGEPLVLDCQGLLANKRALLAQWRSGDAKSLVICTNDWSSGSAGEYCEVAGDICKIREASSVWNIVFVTGMTSVGRKISEMFPDCESLTDHSFLFTQLCAKSRQSILASAIKFQGCDVRLKQILGIAGENVDADLDGYLDACSVVELLSSQGSPSVGSALAAGVEHYVERSLGRATAVRASLFRQDVLRETVAVRVMHCEAPADLGLAKRAVGMSSRDFNIGSRNGLFEKAIHFLCSLKDFRSMDHVQEEHVQKLIQSPLVLDKSGVFIGPKFQLGLFECNSVGLRCGQDDAVTALRVRASKLVSKQTCYLFVSDKTNEQDFKSLSDFVQSKHLLSLEHGQLRWIESHGDIESIRPHIDQEQVTRTVPETAMDVEDRLVLVCAEPGMGKSTLMTRLAKNTKEAHPHYFVILVALNDHAQLFAEDKHKDALGFLSSASKIESPLQRSLLKHALEVSGNVVVLFDGFDEIAPTYVKQSCHLLSSLHKESKASKIWMTSRNTAKQTLEVCVSMFSGCLLKFSEDDLKSFLSNFWKSKSSLRKTELDEVIDKLLGSISQTIRDDQKNFLGIPLQTRMLAEVYEDHATGSAEKTSLPAKLDLLELLEQFVDKKNKVYVQNKVKIQKHDTDYDYHCEEFKETLSKSHSTAALRLVLGDDDITRFGIERVVHESLVFFEKIKCGKDKTGFVDDIVNGKPRFVHRVYAEFFVAKWTSEHFAGNRELISAKMFTDDFAVVRSIFDRILSKGFALHTAVLDEDLEGVRTLLESEDVDVEVQDGGGRTALHLAASLGTSGDRETNKRRGEIQGLLIGKTSDFDQVDDVLGFSPPRYADVTRSWTAIDKLLHCTKNKEQFNLTLADVTNHGMLDNILDLDLDHLLCFCLDHGLQVEHCSEGESRLIIRACKKGSVKVASCLKERNANIITVDGNEENKSPLQAASARGHLEIVELLCQKPKSTLGNFSHPEANGSVANNIDLANYVNMGDKNGRTAIHLAALNGHSDVVSFLISQGGDPRSQGSRNNTPLHLAALNKHPGALRVLLEAVDEDDKAAAVNSCDNDGDSVLMCGAWGGCLECVELLVQAGGKITKASDDGWTPLMAAAQEGYQEVVSSLLQSFKADIEGMSMIDYVNMGNKYGWTAIHFAALNGHSDVVSFLISQGGDPRSQASHNITPLHLAAKYKHPGAVRVLLEAVDEDNRADAVNSCDNAGDSVLMCGALGGCLECVELLVQAGGKMTKAWDDGWTPLMTAAWKGYQKGVSNLLHSFKAEREGMSKMDYVNMGNNDGWTAIHLAAWNGHSDVVSFLISQGGDPRSQGSNNITPLHLAAENKHPGAVRVLLEAVDEDNRADAVNSCDNAGDSALMCGALGGCLECVELLVQAGGKMTKASDDGCTPLMTAAWKGYQEGVSNLLHSFKAEREDMSKMDYVNMGDKNGWTAIHLAALNGHSDVVSFLISQGGDPRRQESHHSTPLHMAAEYKHPGALRVLLEAVDEDNRADAVNSCDNDGDSVLMCGALGGCLECVELLVQAGGKITEVNNNLRTPLMAAADKNHLPVVSHLLLAFDAEREGMSQLAFVSMQDKDGKTALDLANSECRRAMETVPQ